MGSVAEVIEDVLGGNHHHISEILGIVGGFRHAGRGVPSRSWWSLVGPSSWLGSSGVILRLKAEATGGAPRYLRCHD